MDTMTLILFLASVVFMHVTGSSLFGLLAILFLFWSWMENNQKEDTTEEYDSEEENFQNIYDQIKETVNSETCGSGLYTEAIEKNAFRIVVSILDDLTEYENRKMLLEALDNRLMHFFKYYKNAPTGTLQTPESPLRIVIQNAIASQVLEWQYDPKLALLVKWCESHHDDDDDAVQKED